MRLQSITQEIADGSSASFRFSDEVQAYFVGVRGFAATFEYDIYRLRQMGVALAPTRVDSSTVDVAASINLAESGGGNLVSDGRVWATVVAWTGSENTAFLATVDDLEDEAQNRETGDRPLFTGAALSSFDIQFPDNQRFTSMHAGVRAMSQDRGVQVSGSASANCDQLSAGVVAGLDPGAGFAIRTAYVFMMTQRNASMNATFSGSIEQPAPLLSSLSLGGLPSGISPQGPPMYQIAAGALHWDEGRQELTAPAMTVDGSTAGTDVNVTIRSADGSIVSAHNHASFLVVADQS